MEKTLKEYKEKKQDKIFNKYGGFFAFNNKQFDEQKDIKVKKYVRLSFGLICPKENAKKLLNELDQLHKKAIKKHMEKDTIKDIVFKNCQNMELQYSFNGEQDIKEILKDYPIEEIEIIKHYQDYITYCVDNDLI